MPSSLALRDELETMVLKELLGPAGGPDEEIMESPGTRYFVGVLAPRKRAKAGAAPGCARSCHPLPRRRRGRGSGRRDARRGRTCSGWQGHQQDGTTDQAPAQDKALIPSSFGMTFCVNLEATDLRGHGVVGTVRPAAQRVPRQ